MQRNLVRAVAPAMATMSRVPTRSISGLVHKPNKIKAGQAFMQRQGTLKGGDAPTYLRGESDRVVSNGLLAGSMIALGLSVVGMNDMSFGWGKKNRG